MNRQQPLCTLFVVLILVQAFSPALLWAAEPLGGQIETNDRVIISAINEGALTAETNSGSRTLRFGETVNVGEELKTGNRAMAEILVSNRAVITLGQNTTAQLITVSPEQTTIQVHKGIVRVAASAPTLGENGIMIIQTPTNQVETRGGIVQVMVTALVDSVAQSQGREAKPYLVSNSPHSMVSALTTGSDIVQVEEGTAKIPGAGPGGETLTVTSGQSVTLQSGQAGSIVELESQDMMRPRVLASADHTNTPKEGVDNLVALQVDQAAQLGQALTGAAKTGEDESGKKDESKDSINGATGGVQLASVVNTLFGDGGASNPGTSNPTNSTGNGFGGNNSAGFGAATAENITVRVNGPARTTTTDEGGQIKPKSLLVFTTKEPVQSFETDEMGKILIDEMGKMVKCGNQCLTDRIDPTNGNFNNVSFNPLPSVSSVFTVKKELVLIGGDSNTSHGGIAPIETLIVRGAAPIEPDQSFTNVAATTSPSFFDAPSDGLFPTDRFPADIGLFPDQAGGTEVPPQIVRANSTFVVEATSNIESVEDEDGDPIEALVGGTLGQFSNRDDNGAIIGNPALGNSGKSAVDGAITATGSNVMLTGGVTLDRGTIATIGETTATNNYDTSLGGSDAKFTGSLLSVINGPPGPTALTVQDRLLGVYDGSMIKTEGGNKALLSVLDAKLTGTTGVPLIDINAAFLDADKDKGVGGTPKVTVTSAVVMRSTIPLDGALLEASAPILALTIAEMTTTSHFADLAGKFENMDANQPLSMKLDDVLVALNASKLMINNGNLLNLNNATATLGYLFSLNNSSTLTIGIGEGNGTLFSLNNGSALNLNANALGVFGSGSNTLAIKNDLCAGSCGTLVNSSNIPILLNGAELKVAGVTQDVVLPNSFNVFAGNPASNIDISQNAALFHVDDTSTLTINGTAVVN